MKIGLFIKKQVVNETLEKEIADKITSFGYQIDNENPDVVFSIGGDGTFLRAIHHYLDKSDKVSFLALNKGKLGFFSDYKVEDLDEILSSLKDKKPHKFRLLEADISDKTIYALNEIRIENPFHTLISEVYVNDEYVETFRGNGLVVSSSLGSSAYNKSVGGALVDTSLEVLELTEIAPINNVLYTSLKSPLVLSESSKVTFKGNFKDVVVGFDHLVSKDESANEITFRLSKKTVSILWREDHSHIRKLSKSFIKE